MPTKEYLENPGVSFHKLNYFTKNPNLFLRDRAVQVVAAAVAGSRDEIDCFKIIVFVKGSGREFRTIPIPDGIRERLQEQYVAA